MSYSAGLSNGVLYPENTKAVKWAGLINIGFTPEKETRRSYLDGQLVSRRSSRSELQGSIDAYTYPDVLENETHSFDLSYRTMESGVDVLILLYNLKIRMLDTTYQHNEANAFKFNFVTLGANINESRVRGKLSIDIGKSNPQALLELETYLYGTDTSDPRMPTMSEVLDIFDQYATLRVTNHGDGTCTVDGPDSAFLWADPTEVSITWDSVISIDDESYTITSH